MSINQDFGYKGHTSSWASLSKLRVFFRKEAYFMKNWVQILESWQKGLCLSGLSFSVVQFTFFLFYLSPLLCSSFLSLLPSLSFLFSPPLPNSCSHLWKKMASLQFMSLNVPLSLQITIPILLETGSPALLPRFRIPGERILLTQLGTHCTLTRGAGFKTQTWLHGLVWRPLPRERCLL